MTDPHAGKADIKKERPIPNYPLIIVSPEYYEKAVFQRGQPVKIEVPDYNSKPGKLPL